MKQQGASLVELMISMALGLVLTGGIANLYVESQLSNRLANAVAVSQENGNFALHFFEEQLNDPAVSNSYDCDGDAEVANPVWDTVNDAPYDASSIFGGGGIRGYSVDKTNPGYKGGIDTTTLAPETDFLVIRSVSLENSDFAVRVVSHNPNSEHFTVNKNIELAEGELMAVIEPDCSQIGLFVSSNNTSADMVKHNTGNNKGSRYENCTKNLKGEFSCASQNDMHASGSIKAAYSSDAILAKFASIAHAYVIKPIATDINSLVMIDLNNNEEFELVRGVQDMRLTYGMNTDKSNTGKAYVGRYMTADEIDDSSDSIEWADLLSIKVSIDATSHHKVRLEDGSSDYLSRRYERVFAIKSRVM